MTNDNLNRGELKHRCFFEDLLTAFIGLPWGLHQFPHFFSCQPPSSFSLHDQLLLPLIVSGRWEPLGSPNFSGLTSTFTCRIFSGWLSWLPMSKPNLWGTYCIKLCMYVCIYIYVYNTDFVAESNEATPLSALSAYLVHLPFLHSQRQDGSHQKSP